MSTMSVQIQARPYGPESTAEEIAAIKSRMTLLSPKVLQWEEMPVQTPFTVNIMIEAMAELSKDMPEFYLLVDLSKANTPTQPVRAALVKSMSNFKSLTRIVCYTGRNFLLNVAAQFVLTAVMQSNAWVYKTREDALKALT
jgi:hypothetical protein